MTETTWGELRLGDTLVGQDGKLWDIVAEAEQDGRWFQLLSRETGELANQPPKTLGTRVQVQGWSNDEWRSMSDLLSAELGATLFEHHDMSTGQDWYASVFDMTLPDLIRHMRYQHNQPVSLLDSLDKLQQMHENLGTGHGASHYHLPKEP